MPPFDQLDRDQLWSGDVLRLPENYDLGPGSGPVDLLVFEPNDASCGLGLVVLSGSKSGLIYARLPQTSLHKTSRSIDIGWLKDNWDTWFCYPQGDAMRVIDRNATLVLPWTDRQIVET